VKPAEAGLISGGAFVKKPATEKPGRSSRPARFEAKII